MSQQQRLVSVDALRGFTVAAMIVVNNPGSWEHVYAPLLHKPWNGITPTDLIFPFFVFIVGVSIVLAYARKRQNKADKGLLIKKIVLRSAKIFAVGLFLNLYPHFHMGELRVAGVLQRIAIVFLVSGILYIMLDMKTISLVGGGLLLIYWFAMRWIPTPGHSVAMLEPGTNMAAWIDSYLLPGRMWNGNWDPEGVFSTLPAIATGIAGMLAGSILQMSKPAIEKVAMLAVAGFGACVAGVVWGWDFPINKNLWSSSYVLVTAGLASITLASFMLITDVYARTRWVKPMLVFGANAISAYVLAGLLSWPFYGININDKSLGTNIMQFWLAIGSEARLASLLTVLVFVLLIFVPLLALYRKKIFIKL